MLEKRALPHIAFVIAWNYDATTYYSVFEIFRHVLKVFVNFMNQRNKETQKYCDCQGLFLLEKNFNHIAIIVTFCFLKF